MGAADFNTSAQIKGTREDVFAIVKILKSYATEKHDQYSKSRNCQYLQSAYLANQDTVGLGQRINYMTDEDLFEFIDSSNCDVIVGASGPYGHFGFLDEVKIFRDMADAAPNASFVGGMSGFNPGGDQDAAFELKNGLLYCKYAFGDEEDCYDDEEYCEEDEGLDEDDEDCDDCANEEPIWTYEEVYNPVAKRIVSSNCNDT